MVKKLALLLSLVPFVFVLACGSSTTASSPTATPRATAILTRPAGPQVTVEPRSGPPGTQITVRGTGWEPGVLVDVTGLPAASSAPAYETALTDADGSFSVRFRLEATPEGEQLSTGRFDLIARSPSSQAQVPFLVETRRPITGNGPGG